MLGRPFVELCHRSPECKARNRTGGGRTSEPPPWVSTLTAFVLRSRTPQSSCCFSGSAPGSGKGPHHAAFGIARPRAAHGWGGAWATLSPPPREDLSHPGSPPHSRGAFWPERRSGRKARAGHRPGGKARPAFPAFPQPPPQREGGGPAVPDVCSATDFQPTPGANASPTRKPLSRAGRHTRLPPPLPPRTRGREWLPLPPRNVNATSAVVVMRRE